MKRKLLILAGGIAFLLLMLGMGGMLSFIETPRPTTRVQTISAGVYQLTIQVEPNPPPINAPTTLAVRITRNDAPVTNATVRAFYDMEGMNMEMQPVPALPQADGLYLLPVLFTMSGPWQIRVHIDVPGEKSETVQFEVTAQ